MSSTISLPATPVRIRDRALPVAGVVLGTTVVNVLAAMGLVEAFDLSRDFEALQPAAIGGSTFISMLLGVGLLAGMRRLWSAAADTRYLLTVLAGGLLSMAGPASLIGGEETVAGWSAGAVWALVPLHIIPMVTALSLPRFTRR